MSTFPSVTSVSIQGYHLTFLYFIKLMLCISFQKCCASKCSNSNKKLVDKNIVYFEESIFQRIIHITIYRFL